MNTQEMVASAAGWLDQDQPGWHRKIDLGKFDIGDGAVCIIGQVFGEWFGYHSERASLAFRLAFCTLDGTEPDDWTTYDLSLGDDPWHRVESLWVDEIKARFNR